LPAAYCLFAEGNVIGQFIHIVLLARKELLEMFTHRRDGIAETCLEFVVSEGICHKILYIVPKACRNDGVDAAVADDGELPVFDGKVDQDSVAEFSSFHMQLPEDECRPVENIGFAMVFEMNPDLPGSVEFSASDRLQDLFPVDCSEEAFGCW
jgi:hypothetical protein